MAVLATFASGLGRSIRRRAAVGQGFGFGRVKESVTLGVGAATDLNFAAQQKPIPPLKVLAAARSSGSAGLPIARHQAAGYPAPNHLR